MIIAVDFDGTLCELDYPRIGEPIWNRIREVKEEQRRGHVIILWTCRTGELLEQAVDWCANKGLHFDFVNENDPRRVARYGSDSRKISYDLCLDDLAVNPLALEDCPLSEIVDAIEAANEAITSERKRRQVPWWWKIPFMAYLLEFKQKRGKQNV
jgi:hypothetical protein